MAKAPGKAALSPKRKARKRAAKLKERQESGMPGADPVPAGPATAPSPPAGAEVLDQLWALVEGRRDANPEVSHAARLLARGRTRVAQKLGEEAVECVIEIIAGTRAGLIGESADVLYHLLIAWVDAGIRPEEVWHELRGREQVSRLAQGAGKASVKRAIGRARAEVGTTKIP